MSRGTVFAPATFATDGASVFFGPPTPRAAGRVAPPPTSPSSPSSS
ncbi:MAG TPA: hypothetical protein VF546_06760 [Pyrinomonadaceae bacterium]